MNAPQATTAGSFAVIAALPGTLPHRLAVDRLRAVPAARALLLGLIEERDNARAPLAGLGAQIVDLTMERTKLSGRISRAFADARVPENPGERPSNIYSEKLNREALERVEADVEIDRRRRANLDEEIGEIKEREARLAAKANILGATVSNLEAWLKALPSEAPIRAASARPAALAKGEVPVLAVDKCRQRIRDLDADLQRIATAPVTSAEAKKLKDAQLDALAARGRPDCRALVSHGEPIGWPTVRNLGMKAAESGQDAIGLLAWAFRDRLSAALNAEIDAIADDAAALTAEQRAEQRATALRDKLAAERDEEALLRMAIAAGTTLLRRPEADPRAVLGLADDLPGYAPQV